MKYSPFQFALFRFLLGAALLFHFLLLNPFAPELTPSEALRLPFSSVSLPNPLDWVHTASGVRTFMFSGGAFAILFALGFFRRISACFLLLGYACTIRGIPLLPTVRDGLIGFSLVVAILAPSGDPLSIWPSARRPWILPEWLRKSLSPIIAIGVILGTVQPFLGPLPPSLFDWVIALLYICAALLLFPVPSRGFGWIVLVLISFFFPQQKFLPLFIALWAAMLLALESGIRFSLRRSPVSSSDLFIDGECVLCHWFAELILDEDVHGRFRLASLQGEHAKRELPENLRALGEISPGTVVVKTGERIRTKSAAVLFILGELGGIWNLARIFRIIPAPLLNIIYDFIARIRYRMFGKLNECRLPLAHERGRLID